MKFIEKTHSDDRGYIQEIAEGDFHAVQLIFSKKGSIRSNHYHKTGGHLLVVVTGKMRYLEHYPMDEHISFTERTVGPGESVFTGPLAAHATEFLEDTVMFCAATVSRADTAYENDLVRVKLL